MKKLILSIVVLALNTPLPIHAQGDVPGVGETSLGGALGGANSTTAPAGVPSNTLPRTSTFGSDSSTIQYDQQRMQEEQERMTDPTNPMGGSQEGILNNSAPSGIDSNIPRGTAPSTGTTTSGVVPSATGVGTGAPTSF